MMSLPEEMEMDVIINYLDPETADGKNQIKMKGKFVDDVFNELFNEYAFTREKIELFWKSSQLTKMLDPYPLSIFAKGDKRVELDMIQTEPHLGLSNEREFESVCNKRTVIYGEKGKFEKNDIKEESKTLEIGKKWKFLTTYQTFGLITGITKGFREGNEYEFLEFKTDKPGIIEITGEEENGGFFDKKKDTVKLQTETGEKVLLKGGITRKWYDSNLMTVKEQEDLKIKKKKLVIEAVQAPIQAGIDIASLATGVEPITAMIQLGAAGLNGGEIPALAAGTIGDA